MTILDLVGRGGSSPYKSIWKCIVEKLFFVFKSCHLIGTGFTAVEPNCQKQPIQMCHNATFKKLLSSPWHLKCLSLSTLTATIYCSTKMHEREIHVKIQEIIKNNCNFFAHYSVFWLIGGTSVYVSSGIAWSHTSAVAQASTTEPLARYHNRLFETRSHALAFSEGYFLKATYRWWGIDHTSQS